MTVTTRRYELIEISNVIPYIKNTKTYNNTKGQVLSFLCSIYDPSGLIAPCLIEPKLIVQEPWRRNIGWDARLSQDLEERFNKWKLELE